MWLEGPVPPENADFLNEVKSCTSAPIAKPINLWRIHFLTGNAGLGVAPNRVVAHPYAVSNSDRLFSN